MNIKIIRNCYFKINNTDKYKHKYYRYEVYYIVILFAFTYPWKYSKQRKVNGSDWIGGADFFGKVGCRTPSVK